MDLTSGSPPPALRVLVVDDELTIRAVLKRFFSRMGWIVDEASDGGRALEMILADREQSALPRYALVVSDLRMPGVSGMELHDRIQQSCPEVLSRLVFSTGDLMSEESAEFVRHTSCVVLEKPFELTTLRETVERIVNR